MSDSYRIDSHTLMYHPRRIVDWLDSGDATPIYVEISPTSMCNHRCKFCSFQYLGHEPNMLSTNVLCRLAGELGGIGVKSVLLSGEGEPLLHDGLGVVVNAMHRAGLDVALTTNGELLTPQQYADIGPLLTWLRVSVDAGRGSTHYRIHNGKPGSFDVVCNNLRGIIKMRGRELCTISAQMLILPDNWTEMFILAELLDDIGVDYLSLKPYRPHTMNYPIEYDDFKILDNIKGACRTLATTKFRNLHIVYREDAVAGVELGVDYDRCYGMPFWAHIDSKGDVYGCIQRIGSAVYSYGNVNTQSFESIWDGEDREEVMRWADNTDDCVPNCRLDRINAYLHGLIAGVPHVNFI